MRASKKKSNSYRRPQCDTVNPCEVCGWSKHMAIHLPALAGPRAGKPWGHAYQQRPQQQEESQP